jgi:hypothetical protein
MSVGVGSAEVKDNGESPDGQSGVFVLRRFRATACGCSCRTARRSFFHGRVSRLFRSPVAEPGFFGLAQIELPEKRAFDSSAGRCVTKTCVHQTH